MKRGPLRCQTVLLVVAWLAIAGPVAVAADDVLEPARLALRTRQFVEALRILDSPARAGDAEAQYLLGLARLGGLGAPPDPDVAAGLLEAAARQGHASAAYALAGVLAQQGQTLPAQHWVARAAELGLPLAAQMAREGRLPPASELPGPGEDHALRLALAFAAARRDAVAALESVGAREFVGETDSFGRALLHVAAEAGAADAVVWLLANGADPSRSDPAGVTPLMLAAAAPESGALQALLMAGAAVEVSDQAERTPLMYAAWADRAAQVQALLAAGANVAAADARGFTALDVAIQRERTAAATVLRSAGAAARFSGGGEAQVDHGFDASRVGELQRGWPPLAIAASRDDEMAIQRLIGAGGDLQARTPSGDTLLHVALDARAWRALRALLAAGADPLVADRDALRVLSRAVLRGDGEALELLLAVARRGDEKIAARLLAAGADAGIADAAGRTPLWLAAAAGHEPLVRMLLAAGVSADISDRVGLTPLTAAAAAGHAAVVDHLLGQGGKSQVRTRRDGATLISAAARGHGEVVALLLRRGFAIDAQDEFGDTALIAAARGGHVAVCERLLQAGADRQLRNRDRLSAREVAERRGFARLAALLGG
jgi:ankyrin repeat protein